MLGLHSIHCSVGSAPVGVQCRPLHHGKANLITYLCTQCGILPQVVYNF